MPFGDVEAVRLKKFDSKDHFSLALPRICVWRLLAIDNTDEKANYLLVDKES